MTSREALVETLYPGSGATISSRLDRIAGRPRTPRPPPTAGDAWLIAYPDQFRTPAGSPLVALRGVLDSLTGTLDGVHVLPMFPSSSDGGFAVSDFSSVDDTYGDWDEIKALGEGRSLMLDLVCNHTSTDHAWFEQFLNGERPGWYRTLDRDESVRDVVRPRPGTPLHVFEGVPAEVWATFSSDQVDLDYRDPGVLCAMTEVLFALVDAGASAIRLDAVAYLWKSTTGSRINEPNTHRIVALWRSLLDDFAPGVLLITETNLCDDDNFSYFGIDEQPEAHAVYQFSLAPLMLDGLRRADAATLATWIEGLPAPRVYLNFLSSHDGVGLRAVEDRLGIHRVDQLVANVSRAGLAVNTYATSDGGERPYELTGTWLDLVSSQVGAENATKAHRATYAVAYALGGIPLVYVHALVVSGSDHAGAQRSGVGRDLNRKRLDVDEFDTAIGGDTMAAQMAQHCAIWRNLRLSSAAFEPTAQQRAESIGPVLIVQRRHHDAATALVAVNLGPATETFDVESLNTAGTPWRDVDGHLVKHVTLGPYEDVWLFGADL